MTYTLPTWRAPTVGEDPTLCVLTTDDEKARVFGEHCALMYRFDVPKLDAWLAGINDCAAKQYMIGLREKAQQWARANRDEELRIILELLQWRMWYWQRDDFLLPVARAAKKLHSAGGTASAKRKRERTMPRNDRIRKLYADLALPVPERMTVLAKRFPLSLRQIRRIVAKDTH